MSDFLKFDAGKPRYTLVPAEALASVVLVLTYGAEKYSADGWRKGFMHDPEQTQQRYIDAMYRHIEAVRMGEEIDKESRLPHLAHAICCLLFCLWHQLEEHDRGDK